MRLHVASFFIFASFFSRGARLVPALPTSPLAGFPRSPFLSPNAPTSVLYRHPRCRLSACRRARLKVLCSRPTGNRAPLPEFGREPRNESGKKTK